MSKQSRRAFIAGVASVAAPAAWAGASAQESTQPPPAEPEKPAPRSDAPRIVEGSPYPTFSRAVVFHGVAYVAGVVGQKPGSHELVSSEFEPQCRQAMENLKASVEASGSDMASVLKCQVFLTDFNDFSAFNRVYAQFFPKNPPARSTVVVKDLVVPGAKLEIDCFAAMT